MFPLFKLLVSQSGQSLTSLWQAALLFSPLAAAAVAVLGIIVMIALIRHLQQSSHGSAHIHPRAMQPTVQTAPAGVPSPWMMGMPAEMQCVQHVRWIISACEKVLSQTSPSHENHGYWTELQALKEAFAVDTAQGWGSCRQVAFHQHQAQSLLFRLLDEVSYEISRQQTSQPFLMHLTEVQAILDEAQQLWSDIVTCVGLTAADVLLPYLTQTNVQLAQARDQMLHCLLLYPSEPEQFTTQFRQMIKHWSARDAMTSIIASPQEMSNPAAVAARFAQFSQALVCKMDEELRPLAQPVPSEHMSVSH